ncbi:MAG: hypothetical protein KAU20_05360 [Nanoarchaeota archaeon]|nr:hypothetical protein [Nanoarchaeota archaeon]
MFAFDNLIIGPVIGINSLEHKQNVLNDILEKNLIVTACITDATHPVFKEFSEQNIKIKPVAVLITVQYKYYYD